MLRQPFVVQPPSLCPAYLSCSVEERPKASISSPIFPSPGMRLSSKVAPHRQGCSAVCFIAWPSHHPSALPSRGPSRRPRLLQSTLFPCFRSERRCSRSWTAECPPCFRSGFSPQNMAELLSESNLHFTHCHPRSFCGVP